MRKMVTPRSRSEAIELVDLACRHRVEAGGGLVEEQDRRVVEQRPGQRHPLAEALGERTARIVGPIGQVDRLERPPIRVRASDSS